ncbi:MAG TPA: hypothetical protein VFA20_33635 [Myxococcaceae bacterium]|nr:hypothetical protein [Myxococcaceae bacterium]
MRPVSHQPHAAHAAQASRPGGSGSPSGVARAAAPAPQDTFQSQNPPAAYQQISGALAGDAAAQQSLRTLNASGRLDGPLLDQLGRLARPGAGNAAMLGQVVKDVANPAGIRQGKNNDFCAATASLAGLARNDPANYARIAADLHTTGRSTMVDGKVLQAKPGNAPGMTATQGLMAPALTEAANGSKYRVDQQGVSHADTKGKHAPNDKRVPGTYASGMERMQEMLEGGNYRSLYIPGKNEKGSRSGAVSQAERLLTRNAAQGQTGTVNADGHWYRVTGAGPGLLSVQDQQSGQTAVVDAHQFLKGAEAVTVSARAGQVGKNYTHHGKHEDPGSGGSGVRSQNPVEDARVF